MGVKYELLRRSSTYAEDLWVGRELDDEFDTILDLSALPLETYEALKVGQIIECDSTIAMVEYARNPRVVSRP